MQKIRHSLLINIVINIHHLVQADFKRLMIFLKLKS